ncbi:MAG: OmpA-like transrane domain [Gammaproteobacteria bacterium]|jgi:opacity protein-like surface antigen|nr:OmpA-like transrane domain [Gammaproteobacteria bacterium]
MKKLSILAATVALGLSSSAFAITAQSGVYVGPFGGWSIPSKILSNNDVTGYTSKSKNWTYGATLGYDYAINQNVMGGAEVSYIDFGKTNYDANPNIAPFAIKSHGVQVLLTSTYVASSGLNAFVKAGGIGEYTALGQNPANSPNAADSVRRLIPATALGIGYMPTQNVNVALQWERTYGQDYGPNDLSPNEPLSQNAYTLGVTYKFAM